MSERARVLLELLEKPWALLTPEEHAAFETWLYTAQGADLYMLMRFAKRKWTRKKSSASTTFQAIQETTGDDT